MSWRRTVIIWWKPKRLKKRNDDKYGMYAFVPTALQVYRTVDLFCPWRCYWRLLGYKTCLDTKPVLYQDRFLYLLSKLQNWICPKTGQYKTCIVSNTKIEASIRATKPNPWQSHLTSETVEIFIQNEKAGLVPMQSRFWCSRLSVGTKPVLEQQV